MNFKQKAIQKLVCFNIELWLFIIAIQVSFQLKGCLGKESFTKTKNVEDSSFLHLDNSEDKGKNLTNENALVEKSCEYYNSSGKLICKGSIDFTFLKKIQNEPISDFLVEKYEAESGFKKKYWSTNTLKTGEWYTRLPKIYQTLKGEVQLKDTGIQISVTLRILPQKNLKGFLLEGEAFSNKILKISWKLRGNLFLEFTKNRTLISINVQSGEGSNEWSLKSNLSFFRRNPESATDCWKVFGIIKSIYASENEYVFFRGEIWTKMTKGECMFTGELNVQNVNLVGAITGIVAPPQNKQITIPRSAFFRMNIKNIVFKDSIFLNDFDKNSFEGLEGVESVSFLGSKLEVMPKLAELFQNLTDLREIYIEDCLTPQLKFGSTSSLKNVQILSLKGSGPLKIDDLTFSWLKNSNLTVLNLQHSHVNIFVRTSSVLWHVNNTLKFLDISYSTITDEQALSWILKDLSIVELKAESLNLRKIPTAGLSNINKTLKFLSLKGNNFRKSVEKHMFDCIFNFPFMPKLQELNLMECHINYLEKGAFDNLPNLKILFISYNNLENLQDAWAFTKPKITHLDLSHNGLTPQAPLGSPYDLGNSLNLSSLAHLENLNLSDGIFINVKKIIASLKNSVKNLTLRNTGLEDLPNNIFQNLFNLEKLDMSFNRNIQTLRPFSFTLFQNLKNLKYLNLRHCRINSGSIFNENISQNEDPYDFLLKNVEHLDVSANNLKILDYELLKMFPKIKILNLSGNSIALWKTSLFSFSKYLEVVYLDENKIETLTPDMLADIKKLKQITLGNNAFICGSYVYEFVAIADSQHSVTLLRMEESQIFRKRRYKFIKNFYNHFKEKPILEEENTQTVNILDWSDSNYVCYSWSQGKFIPFTALNETFSDQMEKIVSLPKVTFLWMPIAVILGLALTIAIVCWKWLDVHLITRAVRNAVALTFLGQGEKEPVKYEYNIFVSYSDKDRSWVIENLLPRLESKGDIKVCLHERDFQVGLGILENIIASIDSSKNIILVLSQSFLKSQWCQYEMHLAQHRLLEKGRDQLLLIFLEYIPPIKRPKTLKYLMMTKTYLEWPVKPKSNKDIEIFWNRLMKSLQGIFN